MISGGSDDYTKNQSSQANTMRPLIFSLILLLALCAVHAQEHVGTYSEDSISHGARVYYGTCVGCHGENGDSVPQVNLRSNRFRHATTDDELIAVITGGIAGTGMPANSLEGSEPTAIVAFLRNMNARLGAAAALGDAGRGKLLYQGKGGCPACHRVNNSGSRTGPDLSDIGLLRSAQFLLQKLREPQALVMPVNRPVRATTRDGRVIIGRRLNEDTWSLQLIDSHEDLVGLQKADLKEWVMLKTSPMPAYGTVLSDAEIADVAAYLLSLRAPN
jgi:putative heme-binding domain-containing protein